MSSNDKECRRIQRDLAKHGELNAVKRSEAELHLHRCVSCQHAAQGLALIEALEPPVQDLSDEKIQKMYDRLIPVVHEIAVDLQTPERKLYWRPALAMGVGLAVALMLIFVFSADPQDSGVMSVKDVSSTPSPAPALASTQVQNGHVDRLQGTVTVDGVDISGMDSEFRVEPGTQIEVGTGSKFNFRVGEHTRVALMAESVWSIKSITDKLIALELVSGKLAIEFDGSSGKQLEVHTPDSVVNVTGTIFTVEVYENQATHVSVVEGSVEVSPIRGMNGTVQVASGEMVQMPGDGRVVAAGDGQRALAAQVGDLEESLVATSGRLVRFEGSPERVKVEVDNRFLGFTPLTVRLSEGPVYYRLSAPGMETFEAKLEKEQVGEDVTFSMNPSVDYQPVVAVSGVSGQKKRIARRVRPSRSTDKASWNLVVRSRAAMTAGDIPFAAKLLEQSIVDLSGDQLVDALSLLAECYSATGKYAKAADTFDRVAALVPGSKIAQNSRYEVGRLAMDHLGDHGRARTAFTAYVASPLGGQLKETAYFSLCELYGREGVQRNALHCFNDFLRMFPQGYRMSNARLWRGVLYQEVEQRWADAERDLMAFIKAKPRHPRCEEARYRIALGRYQVGDKRGALRMLQEYLREHARGQYRVRVERLKRAILDPHFSLTPKSK